MSPLQLKIELLKIGVTHADIASAVGVSAGLVGQVVRMEKRSLRVEEHVSGLLNSTSVEVFGPTTRARKGTDHSLNVQNDG